MLYRDQLRHESDDISFSNWLYSVMEANNLSISKLSAETYISRPTISDHLHGHRLPYRNTLRIYADYFGVNYWWLYEMVLKDSQEKQLL